MAANALAVNIFRMFIKNAMLFSDKNGKGTAYAVRLMPSPPKTYKPNQPLCAKVFCSKSPIAEVESKAVVTCIGKLTG